MVILMSLAGRSMEGSSEISSGFICGKVGITRQVDPSARKSDESQQNTTEAEEKSEEQGTAIRTLSNTFLKVRSHIIHIA